MPNSSTPSASNPTHMKSLIALSFLIIFGWLAVVTFFGPELARAINGPEPVKAKVTSHRRAR